MRNKYMRFICDDVHLLAENIASEQHKVISLPIAHMDGNYFADEKTLEELEKNNRIFLRYCSENGDIDRKYNPNGSSLNIAGIMNTERNIFGMMPHPERASENETGGTDGKGLLQEILDHHRRGR
jgi:phosphoribosylformylglycinamidine synthase